jgi:hypothetical protein
MRFGDSSSTRSTVLCGVQRGETRRCENCTAIVAACGSVSERADEGGAEETRRIGYLLSRVRRERYDLQRSAMDALYVEI